MIYKAMSADGFGIVTVIADNMEEAYSKITRELSKPGRDSYLKDWREGGDLMKVQGGLMLEERIADQLDYEAIGLLVRALAGGRELESLQNTLTFVLVQKHPDIVSYSLPATFIYYCDTCDDVMRVEAAEHGHTIFCGTCGMRVCNAEHIKVAEVWEKRIACQTCDHCDGEADKEIWAVLRLSGGATCSELYRHCESCKEKAYWRIERKLAGKDIVLHR